MILKRKWVLIIQVYMFLFCFLTDINRAVELLDKLQRTGEVPPQKLQALQRVLQSEFCNAVREVRFLPLLNTDFFKKKSFLGRFLFIQPCLHRQNNTPTLYSFT